MAAGGKPLTTPNDSQELYRIAILDYVVLVLLLAVYKYPGDQVGIDTQGKERGTNRLTGFNGGFLQVTDVGFQHAERANRGTHGVNYNEVRRFNNPNLVFARMIMRPGWIN